MRIVLLGLYSYINHFNRALTNRLDFLREGLFVNSSMNILSQVVYRQWYTKREFDESWLLDRRNHVPLVFIAFGWVKESNLRSYRLDIEPVQPDWKASMINFHFLFEDKQRSMVEYSWPGIDGPGPSSVRFGAPAERIHQSKTDSIHLHFIWLTINSEPMDHYLHNMDACIFGEQRAETHRLILREGTKTMAKYMGGWPRMPLMHGICLPSTIKGQFDILVWSCTILTLLCVSVPTWDVQHHFLHSDQVSSIPLEQLWHQPLKTGCDILSWKDEISAGSFVAVAFVPTRTEDPENGRPILKRYLHGVYIMLPPTV